MMKKLGLLLVLILASCTTPVEFSKEALAEKLTTYSDEDVTFKSILEKHKGKRILIDVWASWCSDCIASLDGLKKLQIENQEAAYVFLSLDRSKHRWRNAIIKYGLQGDHYYVNQKDKGELSKFLNLWWIPRYVVVDEIGKIALFKATEITDKNITKALRK